LTGVQGVTTGFRGRREINTVTYDPNRVQPEEMVSVLKKARTFIGIAER
jgi:hypothetical protein